MIFGPRFDGEISFLTLMVVLKDCLGMVLQILLRQIHFGFLLMVVARSIVLVKFVPTATSSAMVIRTLGSFRRRPSGSVAFPYNTGGCTVCVHVALILRFKIKIMKKPSLVYIDVCVDIYVTLRFSSEKYKIVSWKKK